MTRGIPILLYHSVSSAPAPEIEAFTVAPARFADHMAAIVEAGAETLTVSMYVDAIRRDPRGLENRTVLVTFDDGYADTYGTALPEMRSCGIRSTVYVTTGFLGRRRGPGSLPMLDLGSLRELAAAGVEIGGHSHSHPQLDTLSTSSAFEEIGRCKAMLESGLGRAVRTFAYPHGYSSPKVRRLVRTSGYDSACAVVNAFADPEGDLFRIARLTVQASTTTSEISAWISGAGRPLAPRTERLETRVWRAYRRSGVRLGIRRAAEP